MPRCIVIGAKGFIGSAVAAEAARRGYAVVPVDRANYGECAGQSADLLIQAGGNSRKHLDERNPAEGFALSVESVRQVLLDFHPRHFVHVSSGAVYPHEEDPARNREDAPLAPGGMTHYGFHKWLAEQLVRHYAADHLILRVGGCVGPGLRKNALYDLLSGGPSFVHPDSEFQYMDTRDLASAVFQLHEIGLASGTVLNLSARGTVSIRQAAAWAGVALSAAAGLPRRRVELDVGRAAALVPIPETADVVRRFIREVRDGSIHLGRD
ncbi:MAG: SDR family oxidoreductase [Opitutae bacterium]|nr:SDR family oxidoreductase [Opitutae bacterium]